MFYFPIIILYLSAFGAPFFDRQNIINYFDQYSQFCLDYSFLESEKTHYLLWYYKFFIRKYVNILISGVVDLATIKLVLQKDYKDDDYDQLMNFRKFLKVLKKKSYTKKNDILYYCWLFFSIIRGIWY